MNTITHLANYPEMEGETRGGKIIRQFSADGSFWSWAFYGEGKQVA